MTKLWVGQSGVRIPAVERNLSLHQSVQSGSGLTHPPIQYLEGAVARGQAAGT
jgi:hypothetical protein